MNSSLNGFGISRGAATFVLAAGVSPRWSRQRNAPRSGDTACYTVSSGLSRQLEDVSPVGTTEVMRIVPSLKGLDSISHLTAGLRPRLKQISPLRGLFETNFRILLPAFPDLSYDSDRNLLNAKC